MNNHKYYGLYSSHSELNQSFVLPNNSKQVQGAMLIWKFERQECHFYRDGQVQIELHDAAL